MTTLHITVGSKEQLRQDTLQFVQAVENDELSKAEHKQQLQFGSYEDLITTLTPLRLELIQAIAENTPQSMREAARLVDRDVSDVHGDLKQLEVLGVISLEEGGTGGAIQPVVPFDQVEIHVDYPLVSDSDGDEGTAHA